MDTQAKIELLDNAIDLLRKGWCKGELAKDMNGFVTFPEASYACSFCLAGSIMGAGRQLKTEEVDHLLGQVARSCPDGSLVKFNDDIAESVEEVIGIIEQTKTRLQAESLV